MLLSKQERCRYNGKIKPLAIAGGFVRVEGLEPTHLTASDPKSDASANFATPATLQTGGAKVMDLSEN